MTRYQKSSLFKKYLRLERAAEAMQSRPSATSEDIRSAWDKAHKIYNKIKPEQAGYDDDEDE